MQVLLYSSLFASSIFTRSGLKPCLLFIVIIATILIVYTLDRGQGGRGRRNQPWVLTIFWRDA